MFRATVTGVSWVSDCSENPFKWALVLAHLKDCSGKRDGRARECSGEECRHPQEKMKGISLGRKSEFVVQKKARGTKV
ncbi:MAG: hypothetical protein ACK5IJ_01125 [Mangrovibacterium sp.]